MTHVDTSISIRTRQHHHLEMTMTSETTRCPVVRRNVETFHQSLTVGGEHKMQSFERPVLWVQESSTDVVYLHGGKVLKKGEDYSDYYGYLTSFRNRDDDHDKTSSANHFDINQDSTLEMQLITRIMQMPMIETDDDRTFNARAAEQDKKTRQFTRIPDDWRKEMPCEHSPTGKYYPRLEPVLVVESVTWSSKRSAAENEAFALAFIEEWSI